MTIMIPVLVYIGNNFSLSFFSLEGIWLLKFLHHINISAIQQGMLDHVYTDVWDCLWPTTHSSVFLDLIHRQRSRLTMWVLKCCWTPRLPVGLCRHAQRRRHIRGFLHPQHRTCLTYRQIHKPEIPWWNNQVKHMLHACTHLHQMTRWNTNAQNTSWRKQSKKVNSSSNRSWGDTPRLVLFSGQAGLWLWLCAAGSTTPTADLVNVTLCLWLVSLATLHHSLPVHWEPCNHLACSYFIFLGTVFGVVIFYHSS